MNAPKILLYGPFGSGKTVFAATGGKDVKFIDCDGGLASAITYKDAWTEVRRIAAANAIRCTEDDPTRAVAASRVTSFLQGAFKDARDGKFPQRVLVLDSLTKLDDYVMRSVLAADGMLGKHPRIQHWGTRDIMMKEIASVIKAFPVAVIVIAHQQLDTVDDNPVISPALAGRQLPGRFIAEFDEVVHTVVRRLSKAETEFVLENKSTGSILARTRYNYDNFFNLNKGLKAYLSLMDYEINP